MQKRRTYQQLQPEERMTIASMKQQGSSVRAMARTLGRPASTVMPRADQKHVFCRGLCVCSSAVAQHEPTRGCAPMSQAAPSRRVVARGTHPAGMEVVAPADLRYAQANVAQRSSTSRTRPSTPPSMPSHAASCAGKHHLVVKKYIANRWSAGAYQHGHERIHFDTACHDAIGLARHHLCRSDVDRVERGAAKAGDHHAGNRVTIPSVNHC